MSDDKTKAEKLLDVVAEATASPTKKDETEKKAEGEETEEG